MESIKIKLDKIYDFVSKNDVFSYKNEISKIEKTAALLKSKVEILVVIGIGGSYLGSKAVIEALSNSFEALNSNRKNPLVVFAGQNISEDYTHELIDLLDTKSYGIVVISKSGTTTEP